MNIKDVYYSQKFSKQFLKLPTFIQEKVAIKERIFKVNPLHNSLRLHQLHGVLNDLWFISIDRKYRIVFKREPNGDILFISIGKHDLY